MPCGNLGELLRDARVASLPHLGTQDESLVGSGPRSPRAGRHIHLQARGRRLRPFATIIS